MLVSVDLGKHICGVALFTAPDGFLLNASKVSAKYEGADGMAWSVYERVWLFGEPSIWVIEEPEKYREARVKHDDLDDLLAVLHKIEEYAKAPVIRLKPHEWKGNVPKHIHHRRIERALEPEEQEEWRSLDHNAKDAVGIGLYYLQRTRRGAAAPKETS